MPVTISGGKFGSTLSSDPDAQKTQVNQAKKDLDDLQRQIAAGELRKGSKDVMKELNRLEKMGIATFGTGLRGLDTAGSGDKPYTRQQYQRLINALYDPSQRDFDQDTIYPNEFAANPAYYSYLQKGLAPQNDQQIPLMLAGIGSLPVNQTEPVDSSTVMSDFALTPNEVAFNNPTVAGSDIINSNQLYPMLNYPTFNTLS